MPKKKDRKTNTNQNYEAEEDEIETASVVSQGSSDTSASYQNSELDENALSNILTKIEACVESLTDSPRPDTRLTSLTNLSRCFQKFFIDIDETMANSIQSGIEMIMKKASESEKIKAAELIAILSLQLDIDFVDAWLKDFQNNLHVIIQDTSENPKLRAACARALSNLIWRSSSDLDLFKAKQSKEIIFTIVRTARLKGDGKSPVHPDAIVDLQEESIYSWLKICLSLPTNLVLDSIEQSIDTFQSIIQNVSVDLRIAAAEALAVVFEYLREHKNESYQGPHYRTIVEFLAELINLSGGKSVSKKDKKKQRASLRPVLASIQTYRPPEVVVKFVSEEVFLETCALNVLYESICECLGHGVNKHFQSNVYLREMFDLGPPLKPSVAGQQDRKDSKAMRNFVNQQAAKNRSQMRANNRNKKMNFNHSALSTD